MPLYARFKAEKDILNAEVRRGQGMDFIGSLLSVFRASFFKKNEEAQIEQVRLPSKPNPHSKTSLKKQEKNKRNHERRRQLKSIRR